MTKRSALTACLAACVLTLTACDAPNNPAIDEHRDNPLLIEWNDSYGLPPFDDIRDEDYAPAFEAAISALEAEVAAIAANPAPASFENTIIALDKAGQTLDRVYAVFANITNTDTNDTLSSLESEYLPRVTQAYDAVLLNADVFARVKAVYDKRADLGLDEQDLRLVELVHRLFDRAGAALDDETKAEIATLNAEITGLSTRYAQNLLKATKGFKLEVTDEAALAGLSEDFKAALKSVRSDGSAVWTLTVDRSVYETFMAQAENRDLREQMFNGYRRRASAGELDNGSIAIQLAQLRAKRAELLGYTSHAEYILQDNMAKTPQAVEDFLLQVWRPGLAQAKVERDAMQALIGDAFVFAGHDWWHYSEKVRQNTFAFDDEALKPYFELEAVRNGAFLMAERLFGVTLEPVDVAGWHPQVQAYDVQYADTGAHLGLLMMDMYARPSKRGGAWMSGYRAATAYADVPESRPVITNNLNLITPADGEPTLMRFGEVSTLFHEFGHGLHGLLTQIRYKTFSGVSGPRDYTEFPAQILEHWASAPDMLNLYARHVETGEVIPIALVEKMRAASNHNQGFRTTEFIAAALLDLSWHRLSYEEAMAIEDARAYELSVLESYGLIPEIEPRYRSFYFSHIFAGGYSAGYYAYLWSEILDADGFAAFEETGDIFDPRLAANLKTWIYEAGGLRPADDLYRAFRGSDPTIEPLLRKRGFASAEGED